MKQYFVLAFLQICFMCTLAQLPVNKQSEEMKQMIAELKKEIATLETDIKTAEKEDPEAVGMMKTQLNTYKTMLTALDKTALTAAGPKPPAPATKNKLPPTPSPVTPIHLRQPVVAPTVAQATDRLLWYKGKKINDSTLVTTKKTVVQYSRRRQMLIVQPDEKKDSFLVISKELSRNEQRKRELIEQFDKTKNGFIYYPYLTNSLALYDDMTKRLSKAVKNTLSFKEPLPNISAAGPAFDKRTRLGSGPNSYDYGMFYDELLDGSVTDVTQKVKEQLDDAERKIKQLPAIENFPAPPRRETGRCASCDTAVIRRQQIQDSLWTEQYFGMERQILEQVFSAGHMHSVMVKGEADGAIQDRVISLALSMLDRVSNKNRILVNRHGNDIHYLTVLLQVILGHERQLQLLGHGEGEFLAGELIGKLFNIYKKYYDEQMAAKNHDFVLNVPFHLGFYRQMELLGAGDKIASVSSYFEQFLAYNRFALTMELDFVWHQDGDGKLQRRATGAMETKEKIYVWLYPDGCNYRVLPHSAEDLGNRNFANITLPMKVRSGIKTVREDNDQLKDYPYQGAPEYAFRFPDSKINFCDNGPDTLFLAIMGGNEEVAARAETDLQNINKAYTIDMLIFAGQVLINEDPNAMTEGMHDVGNQMLNTISGFMQQGAPETTQEKLRVQYDSYMEMDNQRIQLENAFSSKTARIVFNANNRSTVLTDTYLDTKRKMENEVEIKRGMFHLRMVHEPR